MAIKRPSGGRFECVSWLPVRRALALLGSAISGCAESEMRDDGGAADIADMVPVDGARVVADALPDAESPLDAPTPQDTFASQDATLPEFCNSLDDDGDFRIDESPTTCSDAPNAPDAVCAEGGRCLCRHPVVVPHAGAYDDCNADWSDGCETPLDTPRNCGGCGVVCDAGGDMAECVDTAEGFRCRAIDILDLSVSRVDGDVTCVVGVDHRVYCRGPNAEHAISDTDDETATLDWTAVPMPDALEVHASSRVRADGSEALSICIVTTEREVVCRGDNSTGLLGLGHTLSYSGNHRIALPYPARQVWSWDGDAYALLDDGPPSYEFELWRWGGAGRHRVPEHLLERVVVFSIGDMPWALLASGGTYSWGEHRSFLAGLPDDAPAWETPTRVEPGPWLYSRCFRGVCCQGVQRRGGVTPRGGRCWGGRPSTTSEGWVQLPESIVDATGTYPLLTAIRLSGGLPNEVSIVPDGHGGLRACLLDAYQPSDFPRSALPAYFCVDAAAALSATGRAPAVATFAPEMVDGDRFATSRVDWQAMCLERRPNWWQCWGSHDGWGSAEP